MIQSLIMAIEKIQQDSDTNVATLHRKIQDETRDLVKTSSNKITFDDIKCGKTKELSAVDEQAVIYIKCSVCGKNRSNLLPYTEQGS